MLRLEVDSIRDGKKMILEAEEDVRVEDLIRKTGMILKDDGRGVLISCDKEGVLPFSLTLADLGISSGERLLYLERS